MNPRDDEYRKAKAEGMRVVADMFKATNREIYKYIRDLADKAEKGEA